MVEAHELWVKFLNESVDCSLKLVSIESLREVAVDGTFAIVFDSHRITECNEEILLALHEVYLKEVLTDHAARLELECLVHPSDLLSYGLLLNEDWAKLAVVRESSDCVLVEVALFVTHPLEEVSDDGWLDVLVNFVCLHGCENFVARSEIGSAC